MASHALCCPLRLLVSVRFQILFHRPSGLLFTFPSRYLFTIDHKKYLALRHSRRGFIRDFTSPVLLALFHHEGSASFIYGAITRFGRLFQVVLLEPKFSSPRPYESLKRITINPHHTTARTYIRRPQYKYCYLYSVHRTM